MMGTSFLVRNTLLNFAVGLAASARVFTMEQVARHPLVSGRTQPMKRARDALAPHRDSFEALPWIQGRPYIWRFTEDEKRRQGLTYKRVGISQHTEHWLAIGDVWSHLVFNGLRPTKWFTEGKEIGRFDVFMEVQGTPYLVEIQLTPLSEKEWKAKWQKRQRFMDKEPWREKEWSQKFCSTQPAKLLVTPFSMKPIVPKDALYAKSLDQLKYILRPPQK